MKCYIGRMTLLFLLVTGLALSCFALDDKIRATFEDKYQTWKLWVRNNPYLSSFTMSQEFQEIVELGPKILPLLVEKIDNNPEDFHLQIAISRITKKRFDKSEWPLGKLGGSRSAAIMYAQWWKEGRFKTEELFNEFYDKYKSLKLEKKDKEAQETYQQIVDLGIPVLPYLIDKLESHPEFVPAISKLSGRKLPLTATTADCRQWWATNKEKYVFE